MIYTVKCFGIVNKAEVDVFLELSCFLADPTDVGNLISGSSAFSKSRLNIWKFMFHILLKHGLENSEHYFASVWDECNYALVWAFFGIAFLWDFNENWHFPVLWLLLSFPNLLAYWVQHFLSIIFRIWNSSTGIPSPPLALFIVVFPKAHPTSHSRMSGSRWVITPSWLSGSWRSFLYSQFFCKSIQSCPTLCDPMGHSPTVSSVHRILQTRILEWVAMSSSRGSSQPRDGTCICYVSCSGRQVLY